MRRTHPESQHTQHTVRRVPRSVDRALRKLASESRRSLNDVTREALARGAGVALEQLNDDLEGFFGSWVEDAEVERALDEQPHIDAELWK
ncbi:MAG: hypothetical protein HY901_13315 [Deltaproteobacteria bacterium]|nr:hypothetical protein [Deltaproteobacteria bacterium]